MISKEFVARCEWCESAELFDANRHTKPKVEKLLKEYGWSKFEKRDFCSKRCREEFIKEEVKP